MYYLFSNTYHITVYYSLEIFFQVKVHSKLELLRKEATLIRDVRALWI